MKSDPRTLDKQFTITVPSGGNTDDKFSDPWELPAFGPDARMSCQFILSGLTGGTAPAVAAQMQVSNDGVTYDDLDTLGEAAADQSFTANGSKWMLTAGSLGVSQAWPSFRYMRLKGKGGGTAAPTAWTLNAYAHFSF